MKIIGITMVKNEEDIIEVFVRHNMKFLDALVILENMSTDNTKEILKKLQYENLPIVVIDDPVLEYKQSDKMTNLAKSVFDKFKPDYIIPIDADEFITIDDMNLFQKELSNLNSNDLGFLQRPTYLSTEMDDTSEINVLKRMKHRVKDYSDISYKVIIPSKILATDNFTIMQGNHNVILNNKNKVNGIVLKSINLSHYPIRSKEHVKSKAIIGWLGYLCNENLSSNGQGLHWKYIFDKFIEGEELDNKGFYELQNIYLPKDKSIIDIVLDPLPIKDKIHLRYTELNKNSVFINIIKVAEQIAKSNNKSHQLHETLTSVDNRNNNNYRIDNNGAFSSEWHENNFFFDPTPFKFIFDILEPQSVLDIGCGLGAYIDAYKKWGANEVIGVEGKDMGKSFIVPGALVVHNMEEPLDLNKQFDLVICTEVIEHIKHSYEDNVIKSIGKHAKKMIIFSGAQPIQKGVNHVNCRPVSYWIGKWQEEGWSPLTFETLTFRLLANLVWLRHNILILVPNNEANNYCRSKFDSKDLLTEFDTLWEEFENYNTNIEILKKWPPQIPGTYDYTLIGDSIWETVPEDYKIKLRHLEVVKYICSLFSEDKRILVYGAGTHTVKLLSLLKEYGELKNIVGILDSDQSKCEKKICGLNIYSIDQAKNLECTKIIISSYSYENEIYESIKIIENNDLKVKGIYNGNKNRKEIFDTIMEIDNCK